MVTHQSVVAERRSPFTIFVKTVTGKTTTMDVETSDTVDHIKSNMQVKEGTIRDQQRLTFSGKPLEDERVISDCNITNGSTKCETGRLKGGTTVEGPFQESPLLRNSLGLGGQAETLFI